MDVVRWPLLAVQQVQVGAWIPTAAALGVTYYLFGIPNPSESIQQFAIAYGVAGGVFVAAGYVAYPQK